MKSKVKETMKRDALLAGALIYLYVGIVVIVSYYFISAIRSEYKGLVVPMILSSIFGAIYSVLNYKLLGRVFSKTVVNTFTVTLVITLLALFIATALKSITIG